MAGPEDPTKPKATADDIFAAIYSLVAIVEALEEWVDVDAGLESFVTAPPDEADEDRARTEADRDVA